MDVVAKSVSSKNKNTKEVKTIYKASFRKGERMSFLVMLVMSKSPGTDLLAFYDADRLCGFVYMATYGGITFIIYLAVDAPQRSQGYGSRILGQIERRYPENKLVLSIDRCNAQTQDRAERIRRKRFYLKNGFAETGYFVNSTKEYQEILVKNGTFDPQEFTDFLKRYSNGVLKPDITKSYL